MMLNKSSRLFHTAPAPAACLVPAMSRTAVSQHHRSANVCTGAARGLKPATTSQACPGRQQRSRQQHIAHASADGSSDPSRSLKETAALDDLIERLMAARSQQQVRFEEINTNAFTTCCDLQRWPDPEQMRWRILFFAALLESDVRHQSSAWHCSSPFRTHTLFAGRKFSDINHENAHFVLQLPAWLDLCSVIWPLRYAQVDSGSGIFDLKSV